MRWAWIREQFSLIAIFIALGAVVYVLYSSSQAACKGANRSLTAQRATWVYIESIATQDIKDEKQRERVHGFFVQIQTLLQPVTC